MPSEAFLFKPQTQFKAKFKQLICGPLESRHSKAKARTVLGSLRRHLEPRFLPSVVFLRLSSISGWQVIWVWIRWSLWAHPEPVARGGRKPFSWWVSGRWRRFPQRSPGSVVRDGWHVSCELEKIPTHALHTRWSRTGHKSTARSSTCWHSHLPDGQGLILRQVRVSRVIHHNCWASSGHQCPLWFQHRDLKLEGGESEASLGYTVGSKQASATQRGDIASKRMLKITQVIYSLN